MKTGEEVETDVTAAQGAAHMPTQCGPPATPITKAVQARVLIISASYDA
jgi:hypothetical protein